MSTQTVDGPGVGPSAEPRYASFMSYSHNDRDVATALQRELHRFTRPWYRTRALRVFRDDASLGASNGLWTSIEHALAGSAYFILIASPAAAQSEWVAREVEFWRANRPLDRFLIVLADGEIAWDAAAHDLDWTRTTALPRALEQGFDDEPRYVDLRWARTAEVLSTRDPRFREAVADLAAPLHGRPKDELIGEDVRQHRRSLRLARSAVALLATLTLLATALFVTALVQRNIAREQRDTATSRQLSAQAEGNLVDELPRALLLSLEATHLRPTPEARGALLAGLARTSGLLQDVETAPNEPVTAVAWNPAGDHVAWAAADGDIDLWNVAASHREAAPLGSCGKGFALALAFSPDGHRLAAACDNGSVLVKDLTTDRPAQMLPHGRTVATVAFSPDSTTLVSAGDGRAVLWSVTSGQQIGAAVPGDSAAFAADGRSILVASANRLSLMATTTNGPAPTTSTSPAAGAIEDIAIDPTGNTLATSTGDGLIVLWDAHSLHPLTQPLNGYDEPHQGVLGPSASDFPQRPLRLGDRDHHTIAYSHDGTTLVSGGIDDSLTFWDVATRTETGFYPTTYQERIYGVAFSPDDMRIATGTSDGDILIWNNGASGGLNELVGLHETWGSAVAVDAAGRTVASGDRHGGIRIWDAERRQLIGAPMSHPGGGVDGVSISPDGRLLASSGGGRVAVWDVPSRSRVAEFGDGSAEGVAFSPDGATLAFGRGHDTLLWDTTTRSVTRTFTSNTDVYQLAFSRDGRTLVSREGHGHITLWNTVTGDSVSQFDTDGTSLSLGVSPNSDIVATGRGETDGTVTLWDAASGHAVADLNGHRDAVSGMAFSPDGTVLATGSHDGSIFLWDVGARQRIGPALRGHGSTIGAPSLPALVTGLAMSADGNFMVSVGTDGQVVRWDLRLESWRDRACTLASRNLSQAEWDRFLPDQPYRRTCAKLPAGSGAPLDAPATDAG